VEPARIGRVIHDAGSGAASGERIGRLAGAMSETLPELDFLKDGFNTAKLLGDMGAGSAVTNLALAVAWTHQKGHRCWSPAPPSRIAPPPWSSRPGPRPTR
jgi:hypothetical protein